MLIVSHDMQTIQAISNRILFLSEGRVLGEGDPESMVGRYETHLQASHTAVLRREWGTREAIITEVAITTPAGLAQAEYAWDEPILVTGRIDQYSFFRFFIVHEIAEDFHVADRDLNYFHFLFSG